MRARNRNRSLAGVIVAGLLLGGVTSVMLRVGGEWLAPSSAEAETSAPKAAGTVKPTAAAKPAASSKVTMVSAKPAVPARNASPAATTFKPVSTPKPAVPTPNASPAVATFKPVSAPKSAVPTPNASPAATTFKPGSTPKSAAPAGVGAPAARIAAPAAGSAIVQSSAHLDEQMTYQYNALGRRDPFQSLLNGEYVGSDVGGDAPPDVGGLKVVGIVWGDADQFALVEDARGDSHILRRGDKVMNGFVEALKRDAMVVNLTVDGQSQSVTVPLTRKGDKTNANR
jgi:hypothetical protein